MIVAVLMLILPLFILGLSYWLTGKLRSYAVRHALLDHENERSSHQGTVPRGGGLAIVLSFALGITALQLFGLLSAHLWFALMIAIVLLGFVGWQDDRLDLPASKRFVIHLLTSAAVVAVIAFAQSQPMHFTALHPVVFYGLAIFALAWLLNLFNFMDGIDGIASLQVVSVAVFLALAAAHQGALNGVVLALVLAASVSGFLKWNWPPAKIFMGDVGSATLGLLMGVLALVSEAQWRVPLLAWVIMLSVFIVDASVTLLTRMLTGQRWYEAHRSHAYQRLSRRWQSHKKVSIMVFWLNVVCVLPLALLCNARPDMAWWLIGIVYTPLILLAVALGAGRQEQLSET